MNIQVNVNEASLASHAKQIPFAIAMALTRVAQDAQSEIRAQLPSRFNLRNGWTRRKIEISPARKDYLESAVLAPDYLYKQEVGATEYPRGGRRYLAAPGPAIGNDRIAPKSKRPRALISSGKAFFIEIRNGKEAAIAQRRGRKRYPLNILWWLTSKQRNDDRFKFAITVQRTVEKRFAMRFEEAVNHAIDTAR